MHAIDSLLPSSFPIAQLVTFRELGTEGTCFRRHFRAGTKALCYRYIACSQNYVTFSSLVVDHKYSPGDVLSRFRYEQEYFEFFCNGQAAIECLVYALYALGSMRYPDEFGKRICSDPRRINLKVTAKAYAKAEPTSPIATAMSCLEDSRRFNEWKEARNILSHRMSPGMKFMELMDETNPPDEWFSGITTSTKDARRRLDWLSDTIERMLSAANDSFQTNR